MERQRRFEDPFRPTSSGPPDGDGLDRMRAEFQSIYGHADQIMDSLGHLDAEDYLHQNRQTGGQ